jgi:WD40 repeat protein
MSYEGTFYASIAAGGPLSRWVVAWPYYNMDLDAPLLLWDLRRVDPSQSLRSLAGIPSVNAAGLSPNRRWLVAGGDGVRIWDLAATDPEVAVRELPKRVPNRYVRSIAINSSGNLVFVGRFAESDNHDTSDTGELWQFGPTRAAVSILAPLDSATVAEFSPDGKWLVAGSEDQHVHLWDVTASSVAGSHRILRGHASNVLSIDFSGDSKLLATSDGIVTRIWDLDTPRLVSRARLRAGALGGDRSR